MVLKSKVKIQFTSPNLISYHLFNQNWNLLNCSNISEFLVFKFPTIHYYRFDIELLLMFSVELSINLLYKLCFSSMKNYFCKLCFNLCILIPKGILLLRKLFFRFYTCVSEHTYIFDEFTVVSHKCSDFDPLSCSAYNNTKQHRFQQ